MTVDAVARGILATLTYFDLSDYPLTRDEAWRWWFGRPADLPTREQFDGSLDALQAAGHIGETGSYLHLPGRSAVVVLRLERRAENQRKWRRAVRATRVLQWLPFVRLVAVCNTVAISNARPESDIDVFIVARRGRLWLTRLLVTIAVSLLGLRRHGQKVANRVCLSFFVSDAALDVRPLLLKPSDPYFAFWIDQLVPLFALGDTFAALRGQNAWVREYLPNAFGVTPRPRVGNAIAHRVRRLKERLLAGPFGDRLERLARKAQREKMLRAPNAAATGAAVITDDVLKFHEVDRRAAIRDRFAERLHQRLESLKRTRE